MSFVSIFGSPTLNPFETESHPISVPAPSNPIAATLADIESMPTIPRDGDGPVFQAPWEAQAFAMVVALHERGIFTWSQWASALAREIASADSDQFAAGSSKRKGYYEHWLAALEGLLAEVELISPDQRETRRSQWEAAAIASPHGEPIHLLED